MRMLNGTAALKTIWMFLQGLNTELLYPLMVLILGIQPREAKAYAHTTT
jgi:hypothetical protein